MNLEMGMLRVTERRIGAPTGEPLVNRAIKIREGRQNDKGSDDDTRFPLG